MLNAFLRILLESLQIEKKHKKPFARNSYAKGENSQLTKSTVNVVIC